MLAHLWLQAHLGASIIEIKLDPVSSVLVYILCLPLDYGIAWILKQATCSRIYIVVIGLIQRRIQLILA